jgi:hypothetical protein
MEYGDATASFINSTVVSNTALFQGGALYQQNTPVTITNTILAYNSDDDGSSPNCYGEITSGDYNLVQDDTGCTLTGTLTHVITGTDPLLEPLADNGGDIWTHLLLPGSPALDQIPDSTNGCGTSITEDQRGVARPQNGACDIGAVEVQPVCYAEISGDGTTDLFSEDAGAVQSALDALDPTSDTVKLAGTCSGVQEQSGLMQTVFISRNVTVQGGYTPTNWRADPNPALYTTTLDAAGLGRVVYISGTEATLDGLFITGGEASGAGGSDYGGAIRMVDATLVLSNSTLYDNRADYGGGIYADGGQLSLTGVYIRENTAGAWGGGLYTWGSRVTADNVEFTENTATTDDGGGLIVRSSSSLTLTNSTVHSNTAGNDGAGVTVDSSTAVISQSAVISNVASTDRPMGLGGGLYNSFGTLVLNASTVAYNHAHYGGALYNNGQATTFTNSTLYANTVTGDAAILNDNGGTVTLTNSTVSQHAFSAIWNNGDSQTTLVHSTIAQNTGGVRSNGGGITINSTILANDTDCNLSATTFSSGGYNLSIDSSCTLTATGDLTNTDPLLGSLSDNGGSTLTHLPLSLSLAIDAIPEISCTLITDQRGTPRPVDGACDVGAVELAQEYAPLAGDDVAYTTAEEMPLVVAASGVLSNDLDGDWDPLVAAGIAVAPGGGAVTLAADGSLVYTPTLDFFGVDSFIYVVSDGTLTDTATVTVTVSNVNDPPVADDDAFIVDEDSVDNVLDVLDGDSDVDGDPLTVFAVGDPAHGSAVDNDTEVLYTPDADFSGTDTFTYTVSDGNGGFDIATVTVTVLRYDTKIYLPLALRSVPPQTAVIPDASKRQHP